MPDYDKLTDPEINRLCAERVGVKLDDFIRCDDKPEMFLRFLGRTHIFITPFVRELKNAHGNRRFGYERLLRETTPRQHCVAFLKATEPGT